MYHSCYDQPAQGGCNTEALYFFKMAAMCFPDASEEETNKMKENIVARCFYNHLSNYALKQKLLFSSGSVNIVE